MRRYNFPSDLMKDVVNVNKYIFQNTEVLLSLYFITYQVRDSLALHRRQRNISLLLHIHHQLNIQQLVVLDIQVV